MLSETTTPNWIITPTPGLQVNSTAISDQGSQLLTGTSSEYGGSSEFAIYSYTTDGTSGQLQWSDPLGDNLTQGTFWVALSGDGTHGAAGGEYGSGKGFLRTYTIAEGLSSKQEFDFSSRINEVEASQSGANLVAVDSGNVHLYSLDNNTYSQQSASIQNSYMRSCGISNDGYWIVAGGEVSSYEGDDSSDSDSGGLVYLYQNVAGELVQQGSFSASSGVLRVVISRDGHYIAASTKSGEVLCFSVAQATEGSLTPMWSYTPSDYSIGYSYALAICSTDQGELYVGVGGNHISSTEDGDSTPGYGYSYMLQNYPGANEGEYVAERLWISQLEYCPNPGMNMDAEGRLVTSADGQPIFSSDKSPSDTSETPGNFYLFDVKSGQLYWKYATPLMNWAMAINANSSAVFAGSDDGSVYYWGAPSAGEDC